ncbi:hypothetical protein C8R43DRAFT_981109 [Mycena crocata]|nr:hypothetical protein C8R43DRAFT_981109 [Mycena crocata]
MAPRPLSRDMDSSYSVGITHPIAQAITYTLTNTTPESLHQGLSQHFRNQLFSSSAAEMNALLNVFQAAGIAAAAAGRRAVAEGDNMRHCVRCHGDYCEKANGPTACKVGHANPVFAPSDDLSPVPTLRYPCCDYPNAEEHHFIGRHTTMPGSVLYNCMNMLRCEENSECKQPQGSDDGSIASDATEIASTSQFVEAIEAGVVDIESWNQQVPSFR